MFILQELAEVTLNLRGVADLAFLPERVNASMGPGWPHPIHAQLATGGRHGSPPQARDRRGRHQGRRHEGSRDGRDDPRRHRDAPRRRGPGALRQARPLVARKLPAHRAGDRARHRPARQARSRRHPLRPGAGAQLRGEAEGDPAGPRGRDASRRHPGAPAHPGEQHRLLRPGRALSDGGLGAHVDRDREGRGRAPHHRLRAAVQGRAASGDRRRDAPGRRRRDLRPRRRAGGGRHGARHRDHRARRHDRGAGQRLCRRGQAPAVRARRHRSPRRADRDAGHRRRDRGRRDLRDRPPRPGGTRADLPGDPPHHLGEARARDHRRGRAAADDPADRGHRLPGVGGLRGGHRLRR